MLEGVNGQYFTFSWANERSSYVEFKFVGLGSNTNLSSTSILLSDEPRQPRPRPNSFSKVTANLKNKPHHRSEIDKEIIAAHSFTASHPTCSSSGSSTASPSTSITVTPQVTKPDLKGKEDIDTAALTDFPSSQMEPSDKVSLRAVSFLPSL